MRIIEDNAESIFSFISSSEVILLSKNFDEIKTVNQVGDDKVVIDFGPELEQCEVVCKDPKSIVDVFQRVIERKNKGEQISDSSSEDTDI